LLEAIQIAISGDPLSLEQEHLIMSFGNWINVHGPLGAIATSNGRHFVFTSLHFKAAFVLDLPTSNLLQRKTGELV
jgi:hypothetical protein